MFDLVNETLNEIKVLCQPMRTGKTFESIKGGLPEAKIKSKRLKKEKKAKLKKKKLNKKKELKSEEGTY